MLACGANCADPPASSGVVWCLARTLVNSLRRCCVDVIAESTESRLTRDLMFEAVPNSSASILAAMETWDLGGRMSEIMEVPLLRDANEGSRIVSTT